MYACSLPLPIDLTKRPSNLPCLLCVNMCIFGRGTGKKDLPRFLSVSICIFGRGTGKKGLSRFLSVSICIFERGTGEKDLPRFLSVSICIFGKGTGKDSTPSPIANRAQPASEQTNKQTIHFKKASHDTVYAIPISQKVQTLQR